MQAFRRFQQDIGDRCDEPPVASRLSEIGSFHASPTRRPPPVVHLELHTGDLPHARALYAELCGWRPERIDTPSGSYLALELGGGFGGGIVECGARRPLWLPYVEVDRDRRGHRSGARSSGPPCSWSLERARPAGAASSRRRRAGRSRSGSRRTGLRMRVDATVNERAARGRAERRRRRLRPAGGAPPRRAARPLLPDARLGPRRRGCPAGRAAARLAGAAPVRGPQLAAVVAVHDRHQRVPEGDRAAAQARASDRLRAGGRPPRPARRAAERVGVDRALSGRDAGGGPPARRPLRAAREHRARLHRGAPAPAGAPARGADPARRPRLLGAEVAAALETTPASVVQRPPARPQDRRRAAPRTQPAGDAARARRRATPRDRGRLTSMPGSATTSTRSTRCWPRTRC